MSKNIYKRREYWTRRRHGNLVWLFSNLDLTPLLEQDHEHDPNFCGYKLGEVIYNILARGEDVDGWYGIPKSGSTLYSEELRN